MSDLLFLLKLGDECANFILFSRSDPRERQSKGLPLYPADGGFIDHDRPIQVWNMKSTFKYFPLADSRVAFDLAPSDGQIKGSPVTFIPAPREGASKLSGKARLNPSLIGFR